MSPAFLSKTPVHTPQTPTSQAVQGCTFRARVVEQNLIGHITNFNFYISRFTRFSYFTGINNTNAVYFK